MIDVPASAEADSNDSIVWVWTSFEGRISRSTYWLKYIFPYVVITFVLAFVEAFGGMKYSDGSGAEFGYLTMIWFFINIWFSLAVGAKRCHDRDRSGWFQAIALIPLIGGIWLLVELGFLKGTAGANRFGSDPVG